MRRSSFEVRVVRLRCAPHRMCLDDTTGRQGARRAFERVRYGVWLLYLRVIAGVIAASHVPVLDNKEKKRGYPT